MKLVFVTGDTHGDIQRFKDPAIKSLRRGDTLIICGDFGFLWDGSRKEHSNLKKLSHLKVTIAFIDGCHENFDMLESYPVSEWNGGKVHMIYPNIIHLMRGQVFTIEGLKIFTLGGGHSQDIEIRRSAKTWFSREEPSQEEISEAADNLVAHKNKVDYIITHEPPSSLKNCLDVDMLQRLEVDIFFEQVIKNTSFKMWYFGKCHFNKLVPYKFYAVFDDVIALD